MHYDEIQISGKSGSGVESEALHGSLVMKYSYPLP